MTQVPAQYQAYVNQAATALGISPNIVAAQINLESGFNPNARSSAGAVGIAQFLPSTFRSYGTGSPFNVADAFGAYTNYMKSLLSDFHGDLRNALAAYNAGPGNIGAGMGYANKILSAAGSGDVTVSGGIEQTGALGDTGLGGAILEFLGGFGSLVFGGGTQSDGSSSGGILSVPGAIMNLVTDVSTFTNMISLLFKPAFWLRVGAFFVGILTLILGSIALISAVRNK